MLYIVATPIGNLSDMTFRAIEALNQCDYILCEDTRHSRALLSHYKISKPLKSYHKFNEAESEKKIMEDLQANQTLALISDAGTPGISDPGVRLIKQCILNQISVISIPGPCAAIQALSCSGLDTDRFQFLGFLPKKENELKTVLVDILNYSGTSICYESPHRLLSVLKLLSALAPSRSIVVARELTKKFEEIIRGTSEELYLSLQEQTVKGEIVLLISGKSEGIEEEWLKLSVEDHVQQLQQAYHLSLNEAIKLAAKLRHTSKRAIYQAFHVNDSNKDEIEEST